MKKRTLEMALSSVEPPESPDPSLEQYPTPPGIAADMLYLAYSMGDIAGKRVLDLGCGSGIFSIGAVLLGVESVVGLDKDPLSVRKAMENAERFPEARSYLERGALEFLLEDVERFDGQADTVLMNPPFGAQKRGADRPFLETAFRVARVVYSLHNSGTEAFVSKKAEEFGAAVTLTKNYKFPIPFMFKFHRKEKKEIEVTMFRMEVDKR